MIESLLFSAKRGLTAKQLAEVTGASLDEVRAELSQLRAFYVEQKRAFELSESGAGFLLKTKSQFKDWITSTKEVRPVKLSTSLMETLAITAYRQPVTRAEMEILRGVDSSYALKSLLEKGLLRITGKKDAPGKPMMYGTTLKFLEAFGLKNLKELPQPEEYDLAEGDQITSEVSEREN
ncbi:MAG: SMC-Scp complex subunit ScpB [Bdellovibrionales bacterium RIFOXYD1_FULL_44_7]|nr:MAG: SMC-Scp complex subunit ScpB [Bdellovibrionales bacterium RIFOXYD1_FULL_44_7]